MRYSLRCTICQNSIRFRNCVRRSGQGLNQETNLKRPYDTHWGSYYETILHLILIFAAVVDVLEIIEE